MKRYVTCRWSDQLEGETVDIGMTHTVFEKEPKREFTGLYNSDGTKIYSVDEMDQIGFIRKIG